METEMCTGTKLVFFGMSVYSLTVLKVLHARGYRPLTVVTAADSTVARWARERNISVLSPTDLNEETFINTLEELSVDVFVVAGFPKLPYCVYSLPKYQTLNIHPSLLPRYRGNAPEVAQVLNDERDLGVTIHVIDDVFDHGPIVAQRKYKPPLWPLSAHRLSFELAYIGALTLTEIISDWCIGALTPHEQVHGEATQCTHIINTVDSELRRDMTHETLWRIYCALGWRGKLYFPLNYSGEEEKVFVRTSYLRNGVFVIRSVRFREDDMSYDDFLKKHNLAEDQSWTQFSAAHNASVNSSELDLLDSNPMLRLREAIFRDVLVFGTDVKIVEPNGGSRTDNWLFDFRNIFLNPDHLDTIAELFWDRFKDHYPFQVGGQETAAIPLITAIVLRGKQIGKPVNGFFIRKERKPTGLQKRVEGKLTDEKVILVDDLMNSGSTQLRLVETLEALGTHVSSIFVLMRFREARHYRFASEKQIAVHALFTPSAFGLATTKKAKELPQRSGFAVDWKFAADDPNLFYIVPKSRPALADGAVFFGSDSGTFWALDQKRGTTLWQYKIWRKAAQKAIFSSPIVWNHTVYFGAYDGNLYALDSAHGTKRWVFNEADWIGSSPCIAPDLKRVYVGLEFGLFQKRGGVISLDAVTGEPQWTFTMPGLTHGSPSYSAKYGVVGIGCNDNHFYLLDARRGTLLWTQETGGPIKYMPTFDEKLGRVLFGSHDGKLYVCDITTGALIETFRTEGEIYSTPYIHDNQILLTSFDKRLYCLNRTDLTEQWRFETSGKILCSPVVINEHVYIGSNDGFLYELDLDGTPTDFFHAGERIVNNVVYNDAEHSFFLWTHANELYKLHKTTR